jgi:hypothetical protein
MGEEEREKKFAPARVAAQQIAQCKYRDAKIRSRNDHSDFEISPQQKILSRRNTFVSFIA